ncbi:MAG TPA: hypothetical protein VEH54_00150 [Steroidobacteraceae bacterium]|nr:hypothetical protein [Steroidobacteraceae bacterium]
MPAIVSVVLLVFWLALAYRAYQRGDMLFATVFLLVGIVLTVYRLRGAQGAKRPANPTDPTNS